MHHALLARAPAALLETLERLQRREQRPAAAVAQTQMAATAPDGGFKAEPGIDDAVVRADRAIECPGGRRRAHQPRFEHGADCRPPLAGLDVPGQRGEIAPVALGIEQRRGCVEVAARKRGAELREPARRLLRCVDGVHRIDIGYGLTQRAAPAAALFKASYNESPGRGGLGSLQQAGSFSASRRPR